MKNSDKTAITNEDAANEANEAVTAGDDKQRPMKDGVYVERRQGERRSGIERRDSNSRGASERRNPDRRWAQGERQRGMKKKTGYG